VSGVGKLVLSDYAGYASNVRKGSLGFYCFFKTEESVVIPSFRLISASQFVRFVSVFTDGSFVKQATT
jgi:hypothetical protein